MGHNEYFLLTRKASISGKCHNEEKNPNSDMVTSVQISNGSSRVRKSPT
jgi:hypothetical protein